jgi:hypothetical protein
MITAMFKFLTRAPERSALVRELEHIDSEIPRLQQRARSIEAKIKRIDAQDLSESLPARVQRGW